MLSDGDHCLQVMLTKDTEVTGLSAFEREIQKQNPLTRHLSRNSVASSASSQPTADASYSVVDGHSDPSCQLRKNSVLSTHLSIHISYNYL